MIEVTTKHHEPVEQATVLRSDFDFVIQDKQRGMKLIEEVHELLMDDKLIEAKELLQKRLNNMIVSIPVFIEPTCQVRNLDSGELKTITREAAKLLQVELDETKEPLNYKKHVHHRLGVAVWAISGMLWVRYL